MGNQKILDDPATMDRVLVPDHHDGPRNKSEQMLEKGNDFLARECVVIGLQIQLDLAFPRTDADGANQVEAFIVFDTCANDRRFTARGPRPVERRDQRKATFIEKTKRRAELLPLFLYVARCNVSNVQSPRHRGATHAVAVVGNSTRDVA
jgi:hypothetical protein